MFYWKLKHSVQPSKRARFCWPPARESSSAYVEVKELGTRLRAFSPPSMTAGIGPHLSALTPSEA
eukprot:1140593-Pelagomonas_calceolata.AAC.3